MPSDQPEPGPEQDAEKARRVSRLVRAPRYLLGLVAAAVVGVTVPAAIDWVSAKLGEPATVVVLSERGLGGGEMESAYAVPRVLDDAAVQELAAVESPDDAVPIGPHEVRIAVTNKRAGQVVVVGMRARVTQRAEPVDGTVLLRRTQGGGPVPDIPLTVNLDTADAVARVRGAADPTAPVDPSDPAAAFFGEQSAPIDNGDSVIFQITASTARCTCAWVIVLDLLVDGHREARVIESERGPFRTTAPLRDYAAGFEQLPAPAPSWVAVSARDQCLACKKGPP